MARKYEVEAKQRIRKGLSRYTEILRQASQRGINEEDTSKIVEDVLVELLGYDRIWDITGQYPVRGHRVDWAIKLDDALRFFVEVKPFGAKLRDRHLFQVVSYSAQHNLEWAVLTTADRWQCHFVRAGHEPEVFFEVRFLDESQATDDKVNWLYLLTKEAWCHGLLREEWEQHLVFRPERLGRLLLSDAVLRTVRKELHREQPGRMVSIDQLREALARGVIRGDLYEVITQSAGAHEKKGTKTAVGDSDSQKHLPPTDEERRARRQQAAQRAAQTRRQRREGQAVEPLERDGGSTRQPPRVPGLPTQRELEVPLLCAILKRGGEINVREQGEEIDRELAGEFKVSDEQRKVCFPNRSETIWSNRVRWTRMRLVKQGDLDGSRRGIWALTEQGRKRAGAGRNPDSSAD